VIDDLAIHKLVRNRDDTLDLIDKLVDKYGEKQGTISEELIYIRFVEELEALQESLTR